MLISNTLFECDHVNIFKIPPGTVSLSKWSPKPVIWSGSMKLLEEEQTSVSAESAPHEGLRMKLELYNRVKSGSHLSHLSDSQQIDPWAEVWYNPFSDTQLPYKIANDGSDTIVMTPESQKYYKIISQLPSTGYSPLPESGKGFLLQVALGLSFEDSDSASSFSESMAIYKRHFHNFQEKFSNNVSGEEDTDVENESLSTGFTLPSTGLHDDKNAPIEIDDDDDDDEFGSFVGSS